MPTRHVICAVAELPDGQRRLIRVGHASIGIFNVAGHYHAIRNVCPHQGAALCLGTVEGTMLPSAPHVYTYSLDKHVLRCPWHGWEFDMATGQALFDPERTRVKVYPVVIEDGMIVVYS